MSFADKVDEERPRLKWRPSLWVATGIVAFGLGLWLLAGAFLPPTQRATMIWDRGIAGPYYLPHNDDGGMELFYTLEGKTLAEEFKSETFWGEFVPSLNPKAGNVWQIARATLTVNTRVALTPERHVLEIFDLSVRGKDWSVFEAMRQYIVQQVVEREKLSLDQGLRSLKGAVSNQEKQAEEQTDAWWKNYCQGMVEPYKIRIAGVEAERAAIKPPEIHLVPQL